MVFGELREQRTTVNVGEEYELLYTARQVVEHVSLAVLDPSARGCAVRGERALRLHRVYSESACLLECAVLEPATYGECVPPMSEVDVLHLLCR